MKDLLPILDLLAILQGLILGVLLIIIKKNRKTSIFLGLFLITYVLEFVPTLIFDFRQDLDISLYLIPLYFYMANLPLLYIYCRKLVGNISSRSVILILIPGVVEIIAFTSLLLMGNKGIIDANELYLNYFHIYQLFAIIFSLIYMILIIFLLRDYRKKAVNYYSKLDGNVLFWIKSIVYFIFIYYSIHLIAMFIEMKSPIISALFKSLMSLLNVAFIYWVGLSAYKQSQKDMMKITQAEVAVIGSPVNLSTLFADIVEHFIKEKPYTNPDFTLSALSVQLDINIKKISQSINQNANENFNTFVNKYRVEQAKKILIDSDYEHFSILAIGYEAGFNSKAAFYSAFKKFTNTTPLKFRDNNMY
jgi:AraC-like DNA-binding protein